MITSLQHEVSGDSFYVKQAPESRHMPIPA